MSEQEVKPTRRMMGRFEKLAGKTVDRVGFGGQFFWAVFTDGTYIHLDAHAHAMSYESEISEYWQADMGLISREEYERGKAEEKRRRDEYNELEERRYLATLMARYPDAVPVGR